MEDLGLMTPIRLTLNPGGYDREEQDAPFMGVRDNGEYIDYYYYANLKANYDSLKDKYYMLLEYIDLLEGIRERKDEPWICGCNYMNSGIVCTHCGRNKT